MADHQHHLSPARIKGKLKDLPDRDRKWEYRQAVEGERGMESVLPSQG